MSKILIYTTPARGHLYPIMDAALALAERGHDVRVHTLRAEVSHVTAAGLRAQALDARIEARAIDDWQVRSPIGSVKRALQTFLDRAPFEIEELRGAIDAERPDLLVVDTNAWGAQALASASGIPWATWHPFPMPYPSRDAPPFGPGLPRARGPFGRLRDRLLQPIAIGPLQKFLPGLNALRATVGAPPFAHISEMYTAPPLTLLMTAEPFEYPRSDWPANMKLVGPGLWSPPSTPDAMPQLRADAPVVLVTCSTEFQDDAALARTSIDALGSDKSVQLVCTTAGVDPSLVQAPAGVVVERFVPHAQLLPRAAAVVCHGGMGITQRALAGGVPVCVVPWGRDQLEVGRRVVECGAGTMLSRGKLNPARLRAAIDGARARSAAAQRIRDAFMAAGGPERCASLLEGLLATSSRSVGAARAA